MPRDGNDHDAAGESFWRFSLALYARPGVAAALIALQDRAGLDVNLILFGLWLGAVHGRRLDHGGFGAAADAVAPLNEIVKPLRALRRKLKTAAAPDLQSLRRLILALELAAERRVQNRLAALMGVDCGPREQDRYAAAAANLYQCLGPEAQSAEAEILRRAVAELVRRN